MAYIRSRLSRRRYEHSLSVYRTARLLAARFDLVVEGLTLAQAAILHDCAKELTEAEARVLAGPDAFPGEVDLGLAHGWLAARAIEQDLGILDGEVLRAVRYHNTGVGGGGTLLALLVVADYAEPKRDFDPDHRVEASAYPSLTHLVLEVQRRKMIYCMRAGMLLAPESLDAYNFWLARAREMGAP